MKKEIIILVLFIFISTLLSLTYQNRINSEGLFSVYQGPAYVDRGWPWRIWRCHDIIMEPYGEQGCSIQPKFLIYNISSWFVIGGSLLLMFKLIVKIKKKLMIHRHSSGKS